MFINITLGVGLGVFGRKYQNVTLSVYFSPTTPVWVFGPAFGCRNGRTPFPA